MLRSPFQSDYPFEKLVIVGVGFLGGSIALAAKERKIARNICGAGRDQERLNQAMSLGILDQATTDILEGGKNADLVVFCTPVDRIVQGVCEIHPVLSENCLVTDVGSTKKTICDQISETLNGTGHQFIGSHPLAGSEKTGFEASRCDLFDAAVVVLTPAPETSASSLEKLSSFWRAIGASVSVMSAHEHDQILAMTSHLPHLVASALAGTVSEEALPFAATGYADTTRIAAGDPSLWTSIFMQNAEATLEAVEKFQKQIEPFVAALKAKDADKLHQILEANQNQRGLWERR